MTSSIDDRPDSSAFLAASILTRWMYAIGVLCVATLPDAVLDAPSPADAPISDTFGGFPAFLLHHEAYHLGRMGILRKYLGKDAMRYA